MNVCELRLLNEYGVVIDKIDFMSEPFSFPFDLRIPKATKRQTEYGGNMAQDGSSIAASRYNNAVITLQPKIFLDCAETEGYQRMEELRLRLDNMLNYSTRFSTLGYGYQVRLYEDSKCFVVYSTIIDGTFEIEEGLEWSGPSQGLFGNTNIALTRKPFRYSESPEVIENYVQNPGFEQVLSGEPSKWTDTNATGWTQGSDSIEGLYCGHLAYNLNGAATTSIDGAAVALANATIYYAEAWLRVNAGTAVEMRVIRSTGSVAMTPTVTWTTAEVAVDPLDRRASRARGYNKYDIISDGEHAGKKVLIRKGFTFTTPAADTYYVQFRVVNPSNTTYFDVDRVYLTPASNLPISTASGVTLDPTLRSGDANRFPKAWISYRDIGNHLDDGSSSHGEAYRTQAADGYHINYIDIYDVDGDEDSPADCALYLRSTTSTNSLRYFRSEAYRTQAADGYHINYIDIYDVDGDEDSPADCALYLRSTTSTNSLRYFIVAMKSHVPYGFLDYTGELSGTADTLCSDGAKQVVTPLSGTWSDSNDVSTSFDPSARAAPRGRYHALARVKDLAAAQGNLRLRLKKLYLAGNTNTFAVNTEVTTLTTNNTLFALVDLGIIAAYEQIDEAIFLGSGANLVRRVQSRRTTGTDGVEIDYLALFPCDEFYTSFSSPRGVGTTEGIVISSMPGSAPYATINATEQMVATDASVTGALPYLPPNKY